MPKYKEFACQQCGKVGFYRGERFCSRSCHITNHNLIANPSKRPEVREKLAQIAKNMGKQKLLMTPEARQKAIPKTANALRGRKQPEDVIARRTTTWRKTAALHGGMTPAHAAQLARIQKATSGPNHPNWQGGTTRARLKDYQSPAYVAFRFAVLNRDKKTCQNCGSHVRLDVHHCYVPYAQCVGKLEFLRYHPDNGQTLCRPCHKKTQTYRPDLQQLHTSQLPQHILELIIREIGPEF